VTAAAEKVRVAVLGVGGYGGGHLANFAARPDVDVAAVWSRSVEAVEAAGARHGVALRTDDWQEALGVDDLDAVSIVSPAFLHREMALAALERGCHVLCEKPLGLTAAEALGMLDAAEQAGVVHATNFDWRAVPAARTLNRLVGDGLVGDPFHARVNWTGNRMVDPAGRRDWRSSRELAGFGVLGDFHHFLDELHWHFGPVARVAAEFLTLEPERRDAEDAVSFVATTASSVQLSGQVSRIARANGRTTEVSGAGGVVRLDFTALPDRSRTSLRRNDGERWHELGHDDEPPMTSQDRFVEAIRGEGAVETTFAAGAAALVLAEAMRESSETGRAVELPPDYLAAAAQ
jgi:predicted dehydrogenase